MEEKYRPSDLKVKKLLDTVISKELESLTRLDEEAKEKKNKELRELIKYYFELNKNTEERCVRIANFSLQYLLLCLIASGVLFLYRDTIGITAFTAVLSFLSIHILFFLLVVIVHENGSKDKDWIYGFDGNEDHHRRWFYFKGKNILKLLSRSIFHSIPSRGAPEQYLEGLRSFVRNYHEESIDKKIINNLEQLYLLQAEHTYSHRLCFRLIRLRFWSMITSVIASLAVALLFYVMLYV